MRLEEIDGFFQAVYDQGRQLKLHDPKPGKDFLGNLVKLTGVRSKPVLNPLSPENIKQVSELIRKDLLQSRPVVIVFSYDSETVTDSHPLGAHRRHQQQRASARGFSPQYQVSHGRGVERNEVGLLPARGTDAAALQDLRGDVVLLYRNSLPLEAQAMGFEKRQRAVPAEQGVIAADGVPDQQAVEWIAVIRGVGKSMEGGEDFRVQWFFDQAELMCGGGDFRRIRFREA